MREKELSPTQHLIETIRQVYAKTYPNVIFSMTNHLEIKQFCLAEQQAEIEQLKDKLVSAKSKLAKIEVKAVYWADVVMGKEILAILRGE